MAKKKSETVIRQFKDGRRMFWVGYRVYAVGEDGVISFVAGGEENKDDIVNLKEFLKMN